MSEQKIIRIIKIIYIMITSTHLTIYYSEFLKIRLSFSFLKVSNITINHSKKNLNQNLFWYFFFQAFCSELILWRVDPVGPLFKSGGITELARINSQEISAFSDVAWIPTLLPSSTLGSITNSPSACFVGKITFWS